jgi:hypothetical protein
LQSMRIQAPSLKSTDLCTITVSTTSQFLYMLGSYAVIALANHVTDEDYNEQQGRYNYNVCLGAYEYPY